MQIRRMLALSLILFTPGLLAATLPPIESMPTLDAVTLAPAGLLNGAGYTVDAAVPVIGYMGQFTLRAPAGTFQISLRPVPFSRAAHSAYKTNGMTDQAADFAANAIHGR